MMGDDDKPLVVVTDADSAQTFDDWHSSFFQSFPKIKGLMAVCESVCFLTFFLHFFRLLILYLMFQLLMSVLLRGNSLQRQMRFANT
jgi:hypothetical protein